ncbi:MAG: AI-2E family transporter [Rhodothalassiaceae bacterium]
MPADPAPRLIPDRASPPPRPAPGAPAMLLAGYVAIGIFVLLALAALSYSSAISVPITGALILGIALAPLVRWLGRSAWLHVVSALGLVFGLFLLSLGLLLMVAVPAVDLIEQMPRVGRLLEDQLEEIREPIQRLQQQTEDLEQMADVGGEAAAPADQTEEVKLQKPSLLGRTLTNVRAFSSQYFVMLGLLFFLLLGRAQPRMPALRTTAPLPVRHWVRFVTTCERDLYSYLVTVSLINLGLGAILGMALSLFGMENALFWALLAAVLNFFPFVGLFVGVALLTIDSIATFGDLAIAIWPPLLYLTLNLIEANFVTPAVLGRNLTLNPALIFASVIFWGWLWGIPGASMAVPILLVLNAARRTFQSAGPESAG